MTARDHRGTSEFEDSGKTAQSDDEAKSPHAPDNSAPRSAAEQSGSNLRHGSAGGLAGMLAGPDILRGTIDALGVSTLVRDMQRSLPPDTDVWRRSILGNIRSVLPTFDTTQAGHGSADLAVRSVQLSGVKSLIETMQAQHELTIRQVLPTSNALDSIVPALQELSGFAEMQRSIIASSIIQQIAARPVVDMSALLGVLPSKMMLADILAAADLTRNMDLSGVLPAAFGFPSVSTAAQAATAAQQAAAQVDEAEGEDAAVQAVLEAIGEGLDPEAPPTPEQAAALQTIARLLVALRPHLSEHFTARGWLVGIATNSTLAAFVYVALAHPALLATLLTVASIATGTKWVYDKTTHLMLPPSLDDDEH